MKMESRGRHWWNLVHNVPAYFASLKTSLTPAKQQPVAGIGTDAFWFSKSGKLYFYKGDVSVNIIYRPHGTLVVDTSMAARSGSILTARGTAGIALVGT
jgi:hypothetical protein